MAICHWSVCVDRLTTWHLFRWILWDLQGSVGSQILFNSQVFCPFQSSCSLSWYQYHMQGSEGVNLSRHPSFNILSSWGTMNDISIPSSLLIYLTVFAFSIVQVLTCFPLENEIILRVEFCLRCLFTNEFWFLLCCFKENTPEMINFGFRLVRFSNWKKFHGENGAVYDIKRCLKNVLKWIACPIRIDWGNRYSPF